MKMTMFLRGNEGIPVNEVVVVKAEGSWALGSGRRRLLTRREDDLWVQGWTGNG